MNNIDSLPSATRGTPAITPQILDGRASGFPPVGIARPGRPWAAWENPFLAYSLPALMLLRPAEASQLRHATLRLHLGIEVRRFREALTQSGCNLEHVRDASYLLCTHLDEAASNLARESGQVLYEGERSLLVEFHDDAWGGESAFADLTRWMKADDPPGALLAFYEVALSLGWQGRYRVIDRGDVLLQDLRSRLHARIWKNEMPAPIGARLSKPPRRPRPRWTPARAALLSTGVALLCYAGLSLALQSYGSPIRSALEAWVPPMRTINLAQTLPAPLPQIIREGWLTAHKVQEGWLLAFKTDGGFDTGRANVRTDLLRNVERLGVALAPWPGDLEVIGHTDRQAIRTREYPNNQALSEARARAVAQALRQVTVPAGTNAPQSAVSRSIESSGRGDTMPIDPAQTPSAYAKNRRVEVLWRIGKAEPTHGAPAETPPTAFPLSAKEIERSRERAPALPAQEEQS
jgi:type VI secretion system protein ImpK